MGELAKYPAWNRIFLALELACVPLAFWWLPYSHLPPPGWAVAFIAGAAAAMSVHDDMKGWQKGIWLLIIGAFLITELRAINKDRAGSDDRALAEQKAQDLAFQGMRAEQNADFNVTAEGLKTAIDGIKSTLITANTTLLQTQPHANMRLDNYEFYPSAPSELKANTPYQLNYHYINAGSATATDTKQMAELYIANADDKESQLELVKRFNAEWKTENVKVGSTIVPNTPMFDSVHRTFTDDEMKDINPKKTVYFLVRFEFTDETGTWRTESCRSYQRDPSAGVELSVAHTCFAFENSRVPLKRRR